MKQYPTYKDSKIQGIDELPETWKIVNLKFLLEKPLQYGANESAELDDLSLPRYIRITDFGDNGLLRDETFKSLPLEKAEGYYLNSGDILFARSGATVGKTFQFKDYDGKACFAGYLIKASVDKQKMNSDFLYLYTKSHSYQSWKNSIFSQATIQNIGADKYKDLKIPVPSISEQTAIATFLDQKTSEIDQLITTKAELIQKLEAQLKAIINEAVTGQAYKTGLIPSPDGKEVKFKDSGIEWLGEIPEHWEVKALKYIAFLKSGNIISPEQISDNGEYPVYGGNGFRGYADTYTNEGEYALIGRQGALCGNVNYANEKFFASEHAIVVYPLHNENTFWLGETIRVANFNKLSQSSAQPGIAVGIIKNERFPYPSISEQTLIAAFLKQKIEDVNGIISEETNSITKLKQYKQSLISEAVTGKIDVREWQKDEK